MDLAQPATFGRGAGCDLVMQSCNEYVKKHPNQTLYCRPDRADGERLCACACAPTVVASEQQQHPVDPLCRALTARVNDTCVLHVVRVCA